MRIIALNGSPRKRGNTATLLEHALKGAASAGAKTRLVHLARLKYTGCVSCFACKRRGARATADVRSRTILRASSRGSRRSTPSSLVRRSISVRRRRSLVRFSSGCFSRTSPTPIHRLRFSRVRFRPPSSTRWGLPRNNSNRAVWTERSPSTASSLKWFLGRQKRCAALTPPISTITTSMSPRASTRAAKPGITRRCFHGTAKTPSS